MDNNNNNETRDWPFLLKNFFGIFGYWFLAILQTIFPFLLKRKSVKDDVILITGSGSGIGQLMCVEFAKLGAIIVAWDINQAGLDKTKQLVEENGSKCFTYVVDVSNRSAVYETANRVKQDVGFVYMLVNNAGIVIGKNFLDLKDEEIERTMNVNAMSNFWTYKAFLPEMVQRNRGHLVCISSLAGNVGVVRLADYCASKFAVCGLEESVKLEMIKLGYDGIKSTRVCPWYINTGMFEGVRATLPLLDPKYAVDRIVDCVLKDQMEVVLPRFMYSMLFCKTILPTLAGKCLVAVLGADKSMDEFVGHNKRK